MRAAGEERGVKTVPALKEKRRVTGHLTAADFPTALPSTRFTTAAKIATGGTLFRTSFIAQGNEKVLGTRS